MEIFDPTAEEVWPVRPEHSQSAVSPGGRVQLILDFLQPSCCRESCRIGSKRRDTILPEPKVQLVVLRLFLGASAG
jgi:hypothetical protein